MSSAIFLAKIDLLRAMLEWIREAISSMDFDPKIIRKIELASEEALVNVIHHAYQNRPEPIEITVKAFPKSHIEIAIKDTGPPFNPLEIKRLEPSISLDQLEPGGLGIHFIKTNMDEVRYMRTENGNTLLLIKKA